MKNNIRQYKKNLKEIGHYYVYLTGLTTTNENIGIINEWILDNYVTLLEHNNTVSECLNSKDIYSEIKKDDNTIRNIILNLLEEQNYKLTQEVFYQAFNKYQKEKGTFFTFGKIKTVKPQFIMLIIEKINLLCQNAKYDINEYENVLTLIDKVKEYLDNKKDILALKIDDEILDNPNCLEKLTDELNKIGTSADTLFYKLNDLLEKRGKNLKQQLESSYQQTVQKNIMIASLFQLLEFIDTINEDKLFENISLTEKKLFEDSVYPNMDNITQEMYREALVKLSRKRKLSEYQLACELVNKGKKEKKHIGFYLMKEPNIKRRTVYYLLSILLFTLLISWILDYYLDSNIFAFILLLIPTSEIAIQLINMFLIKRFHPKALPALDYSKGIPEESATMVVVPTIVKNTKKIDDIYKNLEMYYLANKSDHLYFSLLADCSEEKNKILPFDEEISDYGIKKCKELNKKYGQNIFYFVYRKRVYHETELSYLGWERKRGALLQFNKLLLNTFSAEEKEKYLHVENLGELGDDIKYVITLDSDSQLIVDSAAKLVSTMAHPLNHPVLNEEKNKVIKGYGILQPKVSVDIESSNKSIYAQLFAGLGGFDIYNNLVSNIYQDVFNEAIFMGKGIYDLEIFDKVMDKRFPEGLILSHDLLESNYLRAGFTSNIEIVDDFCSSFLTDMTRQHRWTRGDVQITPWLLPKVKDASGNYYKNPINLLGKWKIFDNIRRNLIDACLLLIIIFAYLNKNVNPLWWLFYAFIVIIFPIILYLIDKFRIHFERKVKVKPYRTVLKSGESVIMRSIIAFTILPYKAKLYLDAIIRAFYRMLVSKRQLLKWITAEDAEKTTKNDLASYLKNFEINYIISIIMVIVVYTYYPTYWLSLVVLSLAFCAAPFITYYISKTLNTEDETLSEKEKKQMSNLAYKTWLFFEENMNADNNYLIPDNYQENREFKNDFKTSSTDIGFSLVAVVSAYELSFIDYDKARFYINKIITTVERLQKWNGHLYNWYNVNTLEIMYPHFVSSVDSGNFVASLIVVKEFLVKMNDSRLVKRVESLINATDFSKIYTDKNVFSIGYNGYENELSRYEYHHFASEARLLSYVAIAKGDVPTKHWFCLDKTLTKFGHYKGLISWSGSLFEYYMPLIFMKSYPNTLLDESYSFAYLCQKSYIDEVNSKLPWGISECAYDEFDNGVNYKYKTFSVPALKLRTDTNDRIAISPYSSMMVLPVKPREVYDNYRKFKKLNMISKYGLYESYDAQTQRPVYAYFSHHQGMILSTIANYLQDGVIQKLFMSDNHNKAFDILIKEKMQINPVIDLKIAKYKKFKYQKETIENDFRAFTCPSELPEVSAISNSKYTVLMNDRGNGFSRYKDIQLNRYRKVTENDYGTFLYIKDLKNNKVWSNTFAPINETPDRYEVIFASDKIKYVLVKNDITTVTEIVVSENHQAEIRKITLKNNSDEDKKLELTSYLEPIITENANDVTHRTFNNLFLHSEFDKDTSSLIMRRNLRNSYHNRYLLHRLSVPNAISQYQYETRRENFIGRNRTPGNPIALENNLSNKVGVPIDPVMSMRNRLIVKAHSEEIVYITNVYGTSREQVVNAATYYNSYGRYEEAMSIATVANINNTKRLNIKGEDMRIYNIMLNYLYQTSKININEDRIKLLSRNTLSQENLWKFGISGDRPIITVTLNDIAYFGLVEQVLKAYEYFKTKGIYVDIAIINKITGKLATSVKENVDSIIYRMNKVNGFIHRPGQVYLIDKEQFNDEEEILLNTVARLRLDSNENKSLSEFINNLQKQNSASKYKNIGNQKYIDQEFDTSSLAFYNGFGGFDKDGKEYVVTNPNTPTPWFNILANKKFGTLVSNNMTGFTYAYNSQQYKISSWSNDIIMQDQSEGIQINEERFVPQIARFGFGYTTYSAKTDKLLEELTVFVSKEDTAKLYLLKLKNTSKEEQNLNVGLWLNPVLGEKEEKTSRYLLCDFDEKNNNLNIRNVYNSKHNNVKVFMSSTDKITDYTMKKILVKAINVEVNLQKNEEKYIGFILGSSTSDQELKELVNKYSDVESIKRELQLVKDNWEDTLGRVSVKTSDPSFDYMMNGWYLYQTIAGRILARAGFYQVSGAFGYRDQLQDTTNIGSLFPEISRNQIINNALHQFKEGDVLHWWLDSSDFGLRSRYKDDYLWLVYAVSEYLNHTQDYKILDEQIPFVEGPLLNNNEEERGMQFGISSDKKSLYEHCKLAIERTLNDLGVNGLPRMGGGDWNDGMNKIGIKGKGESVWLGFFYYDILKRFIEITKIYDKDVDTSIYEKPLQELKKSLNTAGWDETYYLRAYYDNGVKVGSKKSDECKIDLISQSFAILSEVIPENRIEKVLNEVDKHLVDKKLNIVKLLTPAFKDTKYYPGYIKDYPEGIRENGGQYTHAVSWYIMALIKAGKIDKAYEIFQMINPVERTKKTTDVNTYKVEPYVIVGDIYSNPDNKARGGWTWYTGSSGWFFKVGLENILGIEKCGNILKVNPNIPSSWEGFQLTYKYLDTTYVIYVNNQEKGLKIDNKKASEISLVNDGKTHVVKVGLKKE